MIILRKYGVATHVYVPIVKRAVVDFAVSADWTPAAGDVKISKDGGAAANVTSLPTAITMGNTAMWDFSLTATEMQAAQVNITVADAATKAVEDQMILIDTYGNASARHPVDLSDSVRAGLTALPNAAAEAAGGLYTRGVGAGQINQQTNGQIDANVERWRNAVVDVLSSGKVAADLKLWLASAPAALSANGYVQAMLLRWLTDNAAGTPNALISSRVDANAQVVADAAGIRTAIGMASANLDTQLAGKSVPGDAMTLTVGERAAVADKLLGRTRAGGADGGRTVAECLAFGRNKWAISAGVLTVYADDDLTPLYTAAVTTAAGDPVTSVDPV